MKVLLGGDFSPLNRVECLIQKDDYQLSDMEKVWKEDDLFILNFETTFATTIGKKINKIGPHLSCSEKSATFLKRNGVTAVTLANNHTLDYGENALMNTIEILKNSGVHTVGAGRNLNEAQRTFYYKKGDEILAVINCCEHEFSYAGEGKAGTNPLDPIQQYYSIREANMKADYVIIIIHGGHEFCSLPSSRMVKTYHFFIDAGADAVINHHQHCYSGYEYYKGKPIYYGLGNFCFDLPGMDSSFYEGFLVRLILNKNGITSEEIPYIQCKDKPEIRFGEFEGFRVRLEKLNSVILNSELLKKEIEKYNRSRYGDCKGLLSPLGNRYLNYLVRRGLLPSMISKGQKLLMKAYVDCESHRDVLLHFLKS